MPHLPTLPTLKCPASPCSCWGFLALGWSVAWDLVCAGRSLPLEPPLYVLWGCLPKLPGLAPLEEDCVDFTIETRYLTCPTKTSIWCCWYLSCFANSSSLVGGTVAAATLAFVTPFFLSLSPFFKEMHIIKARVSKTKFYTTRDALLTPVEQTIP